MGLEQVKEQAVELIEAIKAKIAILKGKIKISDAWRIVQESIGKVVLIIERNVGSTLSGPDKKAAALGIIENVINLVAVAVDIPFVPEWVESKIDAFMKNLLLAIASGSIDALVSTFHDTGVFPGPGSTTPPPSFPTPEPLPPDLLDVGLHAPEPKPEDK